MGANIIKSPTVSDDYYDMSTNNLPVKLGFTPEFLAEVERVSDDSLQLCHKLLASHSLENSNFRAGQLCSTKEQLDFYTKTIDARPMVSRWLSTRYKIPFAKVPINCLSAMNNKSCSTIIAFAR